jgi:phospholipid/cholesterol/gamma-HCH transport system substrate-binding protein
MKKAQLSEVLVGLLFVTGVALLGAYTILITKVAFGDMKKFKVVFREVYGLKEGDAVRVEGHEKGEVKSLRLLPEGGIMCVMEVTEDVTIYKAQSQVRVTPFSPLGGRVIEIERGKDTPAEDDTYTYFGKAKGAVDVEEADVIQGVAEGELLQTLNALVEENRDNVARIITNLTLVSQQLTRTDNILGYLINSEEGKQRIEGVVEGMSSSANRLDNILSRVEEGQGVIGGLVTPDTALGRDVEATVASARSAFGSASNILGRADEGKSALGVLVGDDHDAAGAVRAIVHDVSVITSRIAAGEGTLGKLVHDPALYDAATGTMQNVETITERMESGDGILGVLTEKQAGEDVKAILSHTASITKAVDDPNAGMLGLLVHDDALRGRISRIAEEVERLATEFRDSLEDTREQAPVNAFIGAVFSAF